MKTLKIAIISLLLFGSGSGISPARAEDVKASAKPYKLDTCAVCGMKLADMGKPYTFDYKGSEIKVCDSSEAAEFKKDPAKYLKKIEEAEAKKKK